MLNKLANYLKSDRKTLRSMLIFTTASSLLVLSIPFLIQTLIQQYTLLVFQPSSIFLIFSIALFLFGITVLRILQMHLSEYLQRRLFLNSIADAQNSIKHARAQNIPMNKQYLNYIFESVSLQKSLISLIFEGSTFTLQSVLVLVLISIYHPFFIIYSILLCSAFYYVTVIMGRKTLGYAISESTKKHELIYELQSNTDTANLNTAIDEHLLDYFKMREQKYSHYFRQSVGLFIIKILAAIALLILGGVLLFQNKMTIGQLIASELIVTNLLISLFKFSNLLDYYYDTAASVKKLQVLQEEKAS